MYSALCSQPLNSFLSAGYRFWLYLSSIAFLLMKYEASFGFLFLYIRKETESSYATVIVEYIEWFWNTLIMTWSVRDMLFLENNQDLIQSWMLAFLCSSRISLCQVKDDRRSWFIIATYFPANLNIKDMMDGWQPEV